MTDKKKNYKESLEEIEQIVGQIEAGDLDVDELSKKVKRAATLIKSCKESLRSTQADLDQTLNELE